MSAARQILRTKAGAVLVKVTLPAGALPAAVAYTVSSKRTPEVASFDILDAAEAYFAAEVARCEKPTA